MLSQTTYLLVLLIEECAEVIQRACKCIRFGLKEIQRGKDHLEKVSVNAPLPDAKPNDERLEGELNDLVSVAKMLHDRDILKAPVVSVDKMIKVEKYHRYSVELGLAEPPSMDLDRPN